MERDDRGDWDLVLHHQGTAVPLSRTERHEVGGRVSPDARSRTRTTWLYVSAANTSAPITMPLAQNTRRSSRRESHTKSRSAPT